MRAAFDDLLEPLTSVGLDELNSRAPLEQRFDTKYVVTLEQLAQFFHAARDRFAALQIGDRRVFNYGNQYFDSPTLLTYRAHIQGRRIRFKCRSRHYVDTGRLFFEVKLKVRRGETIKRRLICGTAEYESFTSVAEAFLRESLRDAYAGHEVEELLAPSLWNGYRRITLVNLRRERLTCDFDLSFRNEDAAAKLRDGFAILESKAASGNGVADRMLRNLGIKPIPSCSKYCVGIALTHTNVRSNYATPLLSRYFADANSCAVVMEA